MIKNFMADIAKKLCVELGEEFDVIFKDYKRKPFKLTKDGLVDMDNKFNKELLADILSGNVEVVKRPWKPDMFESYYSFDIVYGKVVVCVSQWTGLPYQHALLYKGWMFRTKTEACAILADVAKELGFGEGTKERLWKK